MAAIIEVSGRLAEPEIMKLLFQLIDGHPCGVPVPLFDVFERNAKERKWRVDSAGHWTAELRGKSLSIEYRHSRTDGRMRALIPWLVFAVGSERQQEQLQEKMGFRCRSASPELCHE